jgi:hypothetical protein
MEWQKSMKKSRHLPAPATIKAWLPPTPNPSTECGSLEVVWRAPLKSPDSSKRSRLPAARPSLIKYLPSNNSPVDKTSVVVISCSASMMQFIVFVSMVTEMTTSPLVISCVMELYQHVEVGHVLQVARTQSLYQIQTGNLERLELLVIFAGLFGPESSVGSADDDLA